MQHVSVFVCNVSVSVCACMCIHCLYTIMLPHNVTWACLCNVQYLILHHNYLWFTCFHHKGVVVLPVYTLQITSAVHNNNYTVHCYTNSIVCLHNQLCMVSGGCLLYTPLANRLTPDCTCALLLEPDCQLLCVSIIGRQL